MCTCLYVHVSYSIPCLCIHSSVNAGSSLLQCEALSHRLPRRSISMEVSEGGRNDTLGRCGPPALSLQPEGVLSCAHTTQRYSCQPSEGTGGGR